jgi:hypothetical protein
MDEDESPKSDSDSFAPSNSTVHSSINSPVHLFSQFDSSNSPSPLSSSSSVFSSLSAVSHRDRLKRSSRPISLALDALRMSHEVGDNVSLAYCVSMLASLLNFWLPHHSLSMQLLRRLRHQCDQLLQHLPSEIGPSFDRSFMTSCKE